MNSPASFIFNGNIVVRALDRDGDPWFVAVDVCNALEIQNVTQAISNLDDDERMTLSLTEGHSGDETASLPGFGATGQRGGARSLNIISESGVYALIFRSNKPEARRFRKWITAEVIPSIRKTGSYTLAEGSEREFLLKETEETMANLRARRDAMNLELGRLERRRRRLGGERRQLSLSGPAVTVEMVLRFIPEGSTGIPKNSLLSRLNEVGIGINRAKSFVAGLLYSENPVIRQYDQPRSGNRPQKMIVVIPRPEEGKEEP